MISRENFIKYINELERIDKVYENINEVAKSLEGFSLYNLEGHCLSVTILQDIFEDNVNDWIGYYIYELDYGKKWKVNTIVDKDGKDIPLKNASNLYDFLIEELDNR